MTRAADPEVTARTPPATSIESRIIAFAAETSLRERRVVELAAR